ncbi:MAG: hypothetical protein ABI972_24355, partial [Acidobacteriota bacterium]
LHFLSPDPDPEKRGQEAFSSLLWAGSYHVVKQRCLLDQPQVLKGPSHAYPSNPMRGHMGRLPTVDDASTRLSAKETRHYVQ